MAARWITRLEGFYFEVEQRAREKHQNADGLTKRTQDLDVKDQEIDQYKSIHLPFMSTKQQEQIPPLVINGESTTNAPGEAKEEDTPGQLNKLKEQRQKGILTLRVINAAQRTRSLPFMSIEQQQMIRPVAPWKGPVALQACKLARAGPRYDIPFIKDKQGEGSWHTNNERTDS